MPSIIKANATLNSGGVQLTTYSITAQGDNSLGINANFICLSRFEHLFASSFRIGAPLPTALANEPEFILLLNSLSASTKPIINSVDIQKNYGLTTFSLGLSVNTKPSVEQSESSDTRENVPSYNEVTTTTDLRSLTGSIISRILNNGVPEDTSFSFSFDYYATSVTAEGDQARSVRPSEPFNVRAGWASQSDIDIRYCVTTTDVYSTRTYRNNLGQYKVTQTVTSIYIQSKFLF